MHPSLLKKGPLGAQGGYSGPKIDPKKSILTYLVTKCSFFTCFVCLSSKYFLMVFFYSDHAPMDIFGGRGLYSGPKLTKKESNLR